MTAREAKAESNHGKWCKISSTITEAIREKCNEGGTSIYIKRSELRYADISYLTDLGYKFIPDDEEGAYCYISWE
jgi:hypothetical protein